MQPKAAPENSLVAHSALASTQNVRVIPLLLVDIGLDIRPES